MISHDGLTLPESPNAPLSQRLRRIWVVFLSSNEHFFTYSPLCGKSGVAIMFKKSFSFSCTRLDNISNSRILGVEISSHYNSHRSIFAFCLYMPPSNYDPSEFGSYADTLCALYDTYSELDSVVFLGDLNVEVLDHVNNSQRYRDNIMTNFVLILLRNIH